ncbi:MAG: hypothetical protein FWC84_02680 [Alphaproteobacteria bacterium]|nr:hypothetical protein [Alphaproteobacteria bacterium]
MTDEKVTEPLADEVEEAIKTRVRDFYAKARQDYLLGPIFNSTVKEWDVHLQVITNFWSKVLLQLPYPLQAFLCIIKTFVEWLCSIRKFLKLDRHCFQLNRIRFKPLSPFS